MPCYPADLQTYRGSFMLKRKEQSASRENVVNLALYRAKKALEKDGFEVVENPEGKITLVIRLAK
ncbi:hypothetical protein LPTSP3_g22920 [Leptospira kobayashii]|uniref:Uncharacterized protein n=1 Tax=Leptospira kobayashii TaxID=1917830 RepID=A0ABM7UKH8_9LEPT|nr:hypothetical protein LPTSP3_g22920 [Leptospira kobayashii]